MPRVSVVIPAYNSARFLGETVQSVLGQTFQDFELIVVDDGSTDNTREVVGGFKDSRIKYIFQSNLGVSAARNKGFDLSHGEYLFFLDSDDVLLEYTLEKSVTALDSHLEVGFSYGQAWIMEENGHIYRLRKCSFQNTTGIVDRKRQICELFFTCLITLSSVMLRRYCFETIGRFDEQLRNAQDSHLFIRIAKKYPIFYIAEPLVKYRIHANQLHNKLNTKGSEVAFNKILGEIFEDPEFAYQFQKWKRPAYSHINGAIGYHAYGQNMALTRHYIRRALKIYPPVIFEREGINLMYKYFVSFLPIELWSSLRELKWRIKGASLIDKE